MQTAEPYNISEKKGGTVDRHYRVDLDCKTEGAEIYYTTDGSLPGLHHYETKVICLFCCHHLHQLGMLERVYFYFDVFADFVP